MPETGRSAGTERRRRMPEKGAAAFLPGEEDPMKRENPYEDLISLPHHVSQKRPRMSAESRAAQFAPFAALSGYGDLVEETGRQTERRIELTEEEREKLGQVLRRLAGSHGKERQRVSLTCFVPDGKKYGGSYQTLTGTVERMDIPEERMWLSGGEKVCFDEILAIELLPALPADGRSAPDPEEFRSDGEEFGTEL